MVTYCNVEDVESIVDTDMTNWEIQDLIDESSALMELDLTPGGINVYILRAICRSMTAYRVMLKDPDSFRIGDYSESRGKNMDDLKIYYEGLIDKASGGINFVVGKTEFA